MPFIGNQPAEAFSSFQKQDFSTSATTSYTLDHPVSNQNEIALFINFVRQEPTAAYTASGTTLTLTSATSSSDDMYCVYLGKAVQTVNPASGSVGSSQISADLITGHTALGATPADTDELLISDAGTLKRVDYSYLKSANTPYFEAYMAADQTLSDASYTKLNFNTETYDSDGDYDHSTNYRFTPTTAGKYLIYFTVTYSKKGVDAFHNVETQIRFNGSAHKKYYMDFYDNYTPYAITTNGQSIMNFNGSSDYVEIFGYFNVTSGTGDVLSASHSAFGGYKLIE